MDAPRQPTARLLLAAVLAAGVAVRLVNWMQVADGSILHFHMWEESDMHFFHQWGKRIAEGDLLGAPRPYHRWHGEVALEVHARQQPGVPFDESRGRELWQRWLGDAAWYQDPLYAYLLGAIYRVTGPRVEPVLILQAAMGLVVAAVCFWLGGLLGGRWTALLAGLMAALYAPLVFHEGTLLRAALQALLTLAVVAAATQGLRAARAGRWWLVAGLSGGLLALTHSTGLLLLFALAALAAWRERGARRRRALLLLAAGLLAALAPAAARNLAVGLPPLASPAYGPVNFVVSNAADRNPWVGFPISAHTGEILESTGGRLLPVMRATLATHEGPGSVAKLVLDKLLVFLNRRETVDNINFEYYLRQAPLMRAVGVRFALVAPLAVAGLWLAGRRRLAEALPLLAGIGSGALIAIVFFTSSRLRLATALMLVPFAALALVEAVHRARAGRLQSLLAPAAAATVAAVVAVVPWAEAVPAVRDSDYIAGNAIALERARRRAEAGEPEAALRTLEVPLRAEPEELRTLDLASGHAQLSEDSARVAAHFVDLHRMSAELHEGLGRREEAWEQARRARILRLVAEHYSARGG